MYRLAVVIVVIFLFGCQARRPILGTFEVFYLKTSDMPAGWYEISRYQQPPEDQDTPDAYETRYSSQNSNQSASLYFLYYRTPVEAQNIFDSSGVLSYTLDYRDDLPHPELPALSTDKFAAKCWILKPLNIDDAEDILCSLWALYGQCVVFLNVYMPVEETDYHTFIEIVKNALDPRLRTVTTCHK